jgi:sulfhydrogenase subunit beta (sulfur reductase)
MNHVAIPKERVNELINKLISSCRVIAPVKDDRTLEFKEIQSAEQICLTDEITYKSPKEFLFPQVERFLHFDENGEISEESQLKKTILFGVRPCDLEAFKVLTAVFTKGKFVDTLFESHLNNTIIIGLGCINEKPGCFCSERGVDKGGSKECDIFLVDAGEYYLADLVSENGEAIIKEFLPGTENASDKGPGKQNVDVQENTLELNFDENIIFNKVDWDRISETCIGCGTCTYICPTCHCFEFRDVAENGASSRYRCWDSCMYPKFTLHTSGHNPRPTKKERYRQRIMHKYVYVKHNFGYTACTGCGRCVRSCPAGINIKSVVKKIVEELT